MQSIGPGDAERLVRDGATLVDARAQEHYQRAHLPRAVSIPADGADFMDSAQAGIPSLKTPVVVYGRDERDTDASRTASELEALGYRSVYVLQGGSTAWWKSGRPLDGEQVESHMDLEHARRDH